MRHTTPALGDRGPLALSVRPAQGPSPGGRDRSEDKRPFRRYSKVGTTTRDLAHIIRQWDGRPNGVRHQVEGRGQHGWSARKDEVAGRREVGIITLGDEVSLASGEIQELNLALCLSSGHEQHDGRPWQDVWAGMHPLLPREGREGLRAAAVVRNDP